MMGQENKTIRLKNNIIGPEQPVYFIADIGANHDGDFHRAIALIHLAAESGAHGVKFQHFKADKIVSEHGFRSLGDQLSHQSSWKKSVTEVYEAASLNRDWTEKLKQEADSVGIDFFSSPYDIEAVDHLDPFVDVYKIGSGDITWPTILKKISSKGKPVLLATGASSLEDVQRAVAILRSGNHLLLLMQCNTNYTGSLDNFKHVNLRVLQTYKELYPDILLGLSDHTPGHAAVLGAVALGAVAIEKHFTDDTNREGPDHGFALDPRSWKEMIDRTLELSLAMGSSNKFIADNEKDTVVVQRRCLRATRNLKSGAILCEDDLTALRPAPSDAVYPYELALVVGNPLPQDLDEGDYIRRDWFR